MSKYVMRDDSALKIMIKGIRPFETKKIRSKNSMTIPIIRFLTYTLA